MRRTTLLLTVLLTITAPAGAQRQPDSGAVADLPTCSAGSGAWEVIVTDPVDATDCSTGGGTAHPHPCICNPGTGTVAAISGGGGVSDHGALTGLTDDDHSGHPWLAGRSGGQMLTGGTGSGENLTLQSTSHATKGKILFGASAAYDGVNQRLGIGTTSPAVELDVATAAQARIEARTTADSFAYLQLTNSVQGWRFQVQPTTGEFRFFDATNTKRPFKIFTNTPEDSLRLSTSGLALFGTGSFGSGVGVVSLANATTRPSTAPTDAVILSSEDVAAGNANLFVRNEAGQRVRLTGVDARVAADVNITTSTALTNVTGLSFNVEAGKTYSFVARLFATGDGSGGGLRYGIGGTATATDLRWTALIHPDASSSPSRVTLTTFGGPGGTTSTPSYFELAGTITVNAAGTLTVQHAQIFATGTSTTKRGSTFHIREIS